MKTHIFILLMGSCPLLGLPKDPSFQEGELTLNCLQNKMSIHSTSETSVLNWGSFSVEQDESVSFRLPSESSAIINNVIGGEISSILGSISSNGQVILVNPAGIVFGKESRIDAASLVASTLDLQSAFFQEGRLVFSGRANGKLIHEGVIEAAGGTVLIGGEIEQSGWIRSEKSVALCSVDAVIFNSKSLEIEHSSAISDVLVNQISGKIAAPVITLLGGEISIFENSRIDASGPENGGVILVGGGLKGQAENLANAQAVFVHPGAQLLANADVSGNGGQIILWSDERTLFSGQIEAHAGKSFGQGGFVEVSSRNLLSFLGTADLHAPKGELGTLLLDPLNIIVATGGGATYPDVNMFAVNAGTTQTIDPATLDAVAASVILQAENDITFTDPITLTTAAAALTAQAGNNIYLDADISTTGGDITLLAGPFSGAAAPVFTGSIGPSGPPGSTTGFLDTTTGGSTTGSILLQAYDFELAPSFNRLLTDTGNITITAENNCNFTGLPIIVETQSGQISISAKGNIVLNGGLLANGFFSGTQISVIADSDHDHNGTLFYFSVSGSSHGMFTNDGDIFIAGENILIEGPNPGNAFNGAASLITNMGGNILAQAFNDFTMIGYGGAINSVTSLNADGNIVVQAGNNLNFIGGTAGFVSSPFLLATGNIELYAGSNILIQPGSAGLFPAPRFSGTNLSFFAGRDIIVLSGPTMTGSALIEGTSLLKIYAQRTIQMSNTALASPSINPAGGSIEIKAGEDVFLSSSLATIGSNSITVAADAAIPVLWSAQSGAFLAGTPLAAAVSVASDLSGGFGISTAPLTTGISFTSVDGPIHLSSSDRFFSSLICNLTIGDVANANELTLTSSTGDITVDPFLNIFITNLVSTGGNVFMMAQNNISMSASGQINAGGNIELVTDNQAPVAPLIGPGAFLMDPSAAILYGGTLKIFTAIRSQNSILGTLNGVNFAPGTLYANSATEQWCTYYPFPGLGTPHTIFYKDCIGTALMQASIIDTEFLFDLHPADEFGPSPFFQPALFQVSYKTGENSTEKYWLRRRKLHFINHPLRTRSL